MVFMIRTAANICILAYGAYIDYKKREIPDPVPAVLMLTGLVSGFSVLPARLAGLALIAGAFLLASKLTNGETPGGDFKLLCALAFSAGLMTVLAVLLLCAVTAAVTGLFRKEKQKDRHIPLCSYVFPGYTAVSLLTLILL